jgi:DNA-binding NarL/FixJ family response regulator
MKILIADDHKEMREEMLALIDQQEDMEVVGQAADGEEAVRRFIDLNPDLVVMDIVMPGINGIEASKAIRASDPGVRILALSNHTGHNLVKAALNAGITGYVSKSRAYEELVPAIRSVAACKQYISVDVDD